MSALMNAPDAMRCKIKSTFCATCLSHDRKLFPVEGLYFDQLCAEIRLAEDEDRVCWECKAIAVKMKEFRYKACKAQAILQNMIRWKKCDMAIHRLSELKVVNRSEHTIIVYEVDTDGTEPKTQTTGTQVSIDFPKREVVYTEPDNPLSPDDDCMDSIESIETDEVQTPAKKPKAKTTRNSIACDEVENPELENPVSPDNIDSVDLEASENSGDTTEKTDNSILLGDIVKELQNDLNINANDSIQDVNDFQNDLNINANDSKQDVKNLQNYLNIEVNNPSQPKRARVVREGSIQDVAKDLQNDLSQHKRARVVLVRDGSIEDVVKDLQNDPSQPKRARVVLVRDGSIEDVVTDLQNDPSQPKRARVVLVRDGSIEDVVKDLQNDPSQPKRARVVLVRDGSIEDVFTDLQNDPSQPKRARVVLVRDGSIEDVVTDLQNDPSQPKRARVVREGSIQDFVKDLQNDPSQPKRARVVLVRDGSIEDVVTDLQSDPSQPKRARVVREDSQSVNEGANDQRVPSDDNATNRVRFFTNHGSDKESGCSSAIPLISLVKLSKEDKIHYTEETTDCESSEDCQGSPKSPNTTTNRGKEIQKEIVEDMKRTDCLSDFSPTDSSDFDSNISEISDDDIITDEEYYDDQLVGKKLRRNKRKCENIKKEKESNKKHLKIQSIEIQCNGDEIVSPEIQTEYHEKVQPKKRNYDRRNACIYCSELVTNFSRHILRKHQNELEVIQYKAIQDADLKLRKLKRQKLTDALRNRGNFLHNSKVCYDINCEKLLLPVKRNTQKIQSPSSFATCKTCLGTYKRSTFFRHFNKCSAAGASSGCKKRVLYNNSITIIPKYESASIELKKIILPHLRSDKISLVIKNDPLILAYGSRLLKKEKELRSRKFICSKMRDLATLLIIMRKKDDSIKTLTDIFDPEKYEIFMDSIKDMCGFDEETGFVKVTSVPARMRPAVLGCIDILYTQSIMSTESTTYKEVLNKKLDDFKHLIEMNWHWEISSNAEKSRNRANMP